ncbi:hypothetical protein [Fibrobacter sp. UWH9]|uniref:hypothetical protein n=1 Tax=Fibrobacter sp. UWH9 TaxID=1896213 RepID=UPI000932EB6C|nr:hypothetical protein [Fibrobacter sp. UWH9]
MSAVNKSAIGRHFTQPAGGGNYSKGSERGGLRRSFAKKAVDSAKNGGLHCLFANLLAKAAGLTMKVAV